MTPAPLQPRVCRRSCWGAQCSPAAGTSLITAGSAAQKTPESQRAVNYQRLTGFEGSRQRNRLPLASETVFLSRAALLGRVLSLT